MLIVTSMEEIMSEQTIPGATPLSTLAMNAAARGKWWEEDALGQRNVLQLPTRVLVILDGAGITTVEQLKAAGPLKIRELEGIGKLGFDQIVQLLRALNRSNGE
jgi:hypothetical protein